eukprot:NODE_13961_length_1136_cov_6.350842.p1 GENE.NODE_13961_length_1136_cov_6.350842~~NODE_13961_length_1136_cov_6.350842.p1  ORF type:complete len:344 (+),score=108.67 NODE_13961_length_1136_cov_6.350842:84-1115(+)
MRWPLARARWRPALLPPSSRHLSAALPARLSLRLRGSGVAVDAPHLPRPLPAFVQPARRHFATPALPPALASVGAGVVGLAKIYGAILAVLVVFQRRVIFPRSPGAADLKGTGGKLVQLAGGEHVALHFPARRRGAPTLVFFHGNGDEIGYSPVHMANAFANRWGLGFFAVEYPGYGAAAGSPSERSIYEAAERLITHLVSPEGLRVQPDDVVLVGMSIGCAVAIEMARRGFGTRLVLISPFTSLKAMAAAAFPIAAPAIYIFPFMLLDKFDNLGKVGGLHLPTLVLHGTRDEIVPFKHGEELAALIDGAEFVPVAGGMHNDLLAPPHGQMLLSRIADFVRSR